MKISRLKILISVLALGLLMACKQDEKPDQPEAETSVYSELQKMEDASLFLQAVEMAGLQDALQQEGLTLFAPTDSSFSYYLATDLGVDSLTGLYNLVDPATFKSFVEYHLLEKKLKAMDVVNAYIATRAKNKDGHHMHLYASSINKNIILNAYAGRIVMADREVGSSVIHQIDGVLSPLTLNGLIRVNPNLNRLRTAFSMSQSNLEVLLNQENQMHTIFCPSDVAVSAFLSDTGCVDWKDFTGRHGNAALGQLLKYHILENDHRAAELNNTIYPTLFSGHHIEILKVGSGSIDIKDEKNSQPRAALKTTDITAINGSIHIIDQVLQHN